VTGAGSEQKTERIGAVIGLNWQLKFLSNVMLLNLRNALQNLLPDVKNKFSLSNDVILL